MFEIENSIHNYSTEEDQPSPSYWDEEWLETQDYRLGFENAMMQVREQYEIRSKRSQETAKPKASETTIKKRPVKYSKETAESSKPSAESFGKSKDNQNTNAQGKPASSTSTVVSALDKIVTNTVHNENQHTDSATKAVANKTELNIPKSQSTFNLESEIEKIKIFVDSLSCPLKMYIKAKF